jgi:nitrous oxide reductase accessory protein NosL
MKRLVFALALVAVVGACKKAEQQPASGTMADSTKVMADSAGMMMSDSTKMMDTTKH